MDGDVTGSGEPEMTLVIFPPKLLFFPLKFEFIATIQIDQWERFPPEKKLLINPKNQSEAASFFFFF